MEFDKEFLDKLFEQAKENPRLRQNFDLRTSSADTSQRMLNALLPETRDSDGIGEAYRHYPHRIASLFFIAENGKQMCYPIQRQHSYLPFPVYRLLLYLQLVQITCSQQIDFLFFQYLDTFIQIAGANYHICNIVIGKRIHIFNKYTLV